MVRAVRRQSERLPTTRTELSA